MATRNSSIKAVLSIDTQPFEKGLKDAEKQFGQTVTKINTQGFKLRSQDWTGGSASVTTGNTANAKLAMPEAARANAKIKDLNATLYLNGKLMRSGAQDMNAFGAAAKNNAGQGILQLGYALDDLQYGIKGVANNIPQLVQSLTGSMKMAGIVGIAVTAGAVLYKLGQQIWDEVSGTKALAEANAAAAESYEKFTAAMMENAAERGKARGEFEVEKGGRRAAGRENQDWMLGQQQKLDALAGKSETELLQEKLKLAEERTAQDSTELANTRKKIEAIKAEIAAINEKEKAAEREWTLAQDREKEINKLLDKSLTWQQKLGSDWEQKTYAGAFPGIAPKDRARRTALQGELGGLGQAEKTLGESDSSRTRDELRQRIEQEIPIEKAAAEGKAAMEALADEMKEVVRLSEEIRVDNLKKAAEAAKELADEMLEVVKAGEAIAEEEGKKQASRGRTMRDLSISEIRSPGRRKKAEKAAALTDRTEALVAEGMDPAQAADVADREQKVADRAAGDRTIRGAGPARKFEGLGGFSFGQRGAGAMLADGNVPTALEASRTRGREALRRAGAAVGKVGGDAATSGQEAAGYLKTMLEKFDLLIQATKKTPAEQAQPVRRE